MAPHPFSRYRLRIMQDMVRIFVIPSLILTLTLRVAGTRLGLWSIPAYPTFVVLSAFVRDWYTQASRRREARRMGGRLAPTIKGKWPGNIDLMLRIRNAAHDDYLCQGFLDLFQEYQSTTLNLRILGADLVRTLPFYRHQCGFGQLCLAADLRLSATLFSHDASFRNTTDTSGSIRWLLWMKNISSTCLQLVLITSGEVVARRNECTCSCILLNQCANVLILMM